MTLSPRLFVDTALEAGSGFSLSAEQAHYLDHVMRRRAGDAVRVFNGLGEFHCPANLTPDIRRGTVAFSKGVWRKNTYNGSTSNAVVPDSLTDLGAGACFNDARVQVALLGRH